MFVYQNNLNIGENMTDKRFFLKGVTIGKNYILGEEHNHLSNVMRLKPNDEIILIGDDEFDYYGNILEIKKDRTLVDVFKKEKNLANPKVEVTAFIAMNKREPMSLMVRMLSELGVSIIVPIITKWTLGQDRTDKMERYQKIADQSVKQCRRSRTMKIMEPQKLTDACKSFKEYDEVLFAYENENQNIIPNLEQKKKIAFLIGPVAGFDKDEAEFIEKSGAKGVTLGKRILRADTAAIAIASVIFEKSGEWKK